MRETAFKNNPSPLPSPHGMGRGRHTDHRITMTGRERVWKLCVKGLIADRQSAIANKNWLPDMDLNHDKQIQSLLCYRYTIGQANGRSIKVQSGESRVRNGGVKALKRYSVTTVLLATTMRKDFCGHKATPPSPCPLPWGEGELPATNFSASLL